jgi:hypothetical protein
MRSRSSIVTLTNATASRSPQASAGQVDWTEPSERVHRAVNIGQQPYEEVTIFFVDRADAVLQLIAVEQLAD